MTGFTSKRQAALDKLFEVENELGLHYDQRTPMTKDEALTLEALKYAASMGHGGMVKEMFAPFTIKSTLAQPEQEPPSEWALIKNILDEYGLQAISFVADWKAAQPAQEPDCQETGVCVRSRLYAARQPVQEPFGYFQYDIRLDAWVQNRINNKGVAFYTKETKK